MEERFWPALLAHAFNPLWQFLFQFAQSREQAITYPPLLGLRMPGLQPIKSVTHICLAEIHSQIPAVQSNLSEQSMARKAQMQLANQRNRCLDLGAVRFTRIELPGTEVVIDMPNAFSALRRDAAEQWRARLIQPNRRQPAVRDEFITSRDLRFQPLDHY